MTTATFPHPGLRDRAREDVSPTTKRRSLWLVLLVAVVLLVAGWALTIGLTWRANMQQLETMRPPLYGHFPSGPVAFPMH